MPLWGLLFVLRGLARSSAFAIGGIVESCLVALAPSGVALGAYRLFHSLWEEVGISMVVVVYTWYY